MSTLSIRLPESLHRGIKEIAQSEGVSINQFIALVIAEKLSALMTEEYLRQRASRGLYEAALARVPDVAPESYDE